MAATLRKHAFSPEEVRRLHWSAANDPLAPRGVVGVIHTTPCHP